MPDRQPNKGGSPWTLVGLLALPVICCGLPALLAAGVFAAAGGWLTAYGFWLGGVVLLLVAAMIGGRWWIRRRRCEISPQVPKSVNPQQ